MTVDTAFQFWQYAIGLFLLSDGLGYVFAALIDRAALKTRRNIRLVFQAIGLIGFTATLVYSIMNHLDSTLIEYTAGVIKLFAGGTQENQSMISLHYVMSYAAVLMIYTRINKFYNF